MRRRSALAATGLLALSCSGPGQTSKPPAPTLTARHLVLVTIDTLRADRLGCYGSTTVETPHLDRIAREGAMALQASAPVPLTLPSHASLMTGRLPPEHGQRDNLAPPLPLSLPTLAEVLKGAGFETAAFISSVVLAARTRLDRGFETYADDFEWKGEARFLNTIQRPGDQTLGLAVEWLEQRDPARRFFAWIHLYDPHEPYEPPEPFASRYAGRPYDGEVAWSDELIGRLYAALERLSLLQHTLLVVVSDHGEGLGDHEETLHGFFVYQTTLRVPLIVRGPGVAAGGRVEAVVQIPDLFPTILDLMGVAGVPEASGRNIAPALRGGEPLEEEPIYAESLVPRLHFGWSELRMLREGRFKFIEAPRPELYDLVADPGETRNIIDQQASRAQAMREALGREIDRLESRAPEVAGDESVPSEVRQQLGALGYLGGASSGSAPGADPKDKIEEFVYANDLIREAIIHFQEGDAQGSRAEVRGASHSRHRGLRDSLLPGSGARTALTLRAGASPPRGRSGAAASRRGGLRVVGRLPRRPRRHDGGAARAPAGARRGSGRRRSAAPRGAPVSRARVARRGRPGSGSGPDAAPRGCEAPSPDRRASP